MSAILRVAVAVLMLAGASQAANGSTGLCSEQDPCVSFTAVPLASGVSGCPPSGTTGLCAYEVCMYTKRGGLCGKSTTSTFSHTCQKNSNTCKAEEATFQGLTATQGVGDLKQCQYGYSGANVYFLLKDGSGCNSDVKKAYTKDQVTSAGGLVTCEGRPSSIPSCTGNAAGVECLWTVKIPTTCSISSTTDTSIAGTNDVTTSACATLDIPTNYLRFDSGDGPSCSIDQAVAQLQQTDPTCTILSTDCQVIKCANPLPDATVAGLSTMSC